MNTDLIQGAKATGSGFLTVGTNGVFLTDIVLNNLPAKSLGVCYIETLTATGGQDKKYKYYKGGSKSYKTDGWYMGTTLIKKGVNDVFFKRGSGLWFTSSSADITFTTSGEVLSETTVDLPLIVGAKMLSNPFADSIKLTSIVPLNLGTGKVLGTLYIETLTSTGGRVNIYKYYQGGSKSYKTDGWYQGTTRITDANDVTFEAGAGL